MLKFKKLYSILKQHQKLAENRSPILLQSKTSKIVIYFITFLIICYLIFLAATLSLMATDINSVTPYELMYSLIPFIIIVDICVRFIFQDTPTQHVKPYVLLPVSRYTCINFFIIHSIISYWNLLWMFLYVPFAIMSILFSEGIGLTLLFILGLYLIELILSQAYLIFKTLINENIFWSLLAFPIILAIIFPMVSNYNGTLTISFIRLLNGYQHLGNWICHGNIIIWALLVILLILSIYINRVLQYKLVREELSRQKETFKVNSVPEFSIIGKGSIGKFIYLEILSIRRNKNIRKSFISSNIFVFALSILCSFTSAYNNEGMIKFWMVYCFTLFATFFMGKIMMPEGNYIERLMVCYSSIESLLRAKYYFFCTMLILPFILMLPMVIMGKTTFTTLLAFFLFAAGFVNFTFMQMAVYNKQTIALNQKLIGKMKNDNMGINFIISILGFGIPLVFYKVIFIFLSETIASLTLAIIGLIFILTHKIWIHNIFQRMTKRKHRNIEAMIATRNV